MDFKRPDLEGLGLLHPSHHPGEDPCRGLGRSTALVFDALARAIARVDEWVEFIDHAPMGQCEARQWKRYLEGEINAHGLQITVKRAGGRVFLRSMIIETLMPSRARRHAWQNSHGGVTQ